MSSEAAAWHATWLRERVPALLELVGLAAHREKRLLLRALHRLAGDASERLGRRRGLDPAAAQLGDRVLRRLGLLLPGRADGFLLATSAPRTAYGSFRSKSTSPRSRPARARMPKSGASGPATLRLREFDHYFDELLRDPANDTVVPASLTDRVSVTLCSGPPEPLIDCNNAVASSGFANGWVSSTRRPPPSVLAGGVIPS